MGNFTTSAARSTSTNPMGTSTFHASAIIWSMRNRGKVARTHMKKRRIAVVLMKK